MIYPFIKILLDILSALARCKYKVEHHLFTSLYCTNHIKSFEQHLTKHDESPLITTMFYTNARRIENEGVLQSFLAPTEVGQT